MEVLSNYCCPCLCCVLAQCIPLCSELVVHDEDILSCHNVASSRFYLPITKLYVSSLSFTLHRYMPFCMHARSSSSCLRFLGKGLLEDALPVLLSSRNFCTAIEYCNQEQCIAEHLYQVSSGGGGLAPEDEAVGLLDLGLDGMY